MPSQRVRLRTAGAATDHPSRAGTTGWRTAGTTVHATLAQAGVSFRGALGLGPSRGQHLRTELLAGAACVPGNLVLHVHGSGQSPRTCVHPEDRVALMERHPGLMGRPDPADGTDLLEENREGQDPESHGARSGSGPRARGTRVAGAHRQGRKWVGAPRARNALERGEDKPVKVGQGPARGRRGRLPTGGRIRWSLRKVRYAQPALRLRRWSRGVEVGMPSGETPARPRPPYVGWCPARVKGPPQTAGDASVGGDRTAGGGASGPSSAREARQRTSRGDRRGLVPALQSTHRTSPAPSGATAPGAVSPVAQRAGHYAD